MLSNRNELIWLKSPKVAKSPRLSSNFVKLKRQSDECENATERSFRRCFFDSKTIQARTAFWYALDRLLDRNGWNRQTPSAPHIREKRNRDVLSAQPRSQSNQIPGGMSAHKTQI
jgi:hypothetical protein